MFKIEFIKPPSQVMGDSHVFLLCESSRSLAEHNFRLNGQRLSQTVQFLRAEHGTAFDRGNQRNVVSFDVVRSVDFAGEPFADAHSALVFALDLPGLLFGVGTLKLTLEGQIGTAERWLDNAVIESSLVQTIGVALQYTHTVNGGEITDQEP